MFKILKPKGKIYDIAADEFQKYSFEITGVKPEIITEDDKRSELVVLGTDAENELVAEYIISGKFKGFSIRYGTDDFCLCSEVIDERNHLFIGGGRDRALLYAVYTYFEKVCGCRWFWDGDIVPKAESLKLDNIDIYEKPRFLYRGLRYFAHRGLSRFQAEQWGFSDWKKEIDWMLKKKLNMFMLRIGNDDIFQKAFPDIVSYPDENVREDKKGFYNRTTAWSLKYRGELRKKILDYAFLRDLMHPEDFGTTTHWYTPTPQDFLDKEKPDFFANISEGYNDNDLLVWNIRKEKNMDNYMKLTDAHIKEYGKPELFHTIGFAERLFSDNKELNLRMKLYVYRKTMARIMKKYPQGKILLASWDLTGYYTPEEVRKLTNELDPERVIILDYTSDTTYENNFTKWDVIGKFPYIFGIFQAYCSHSGALGRFDVIEERLKIAKEDDYCKGMIFWPELAHGDSFMTEYFAKNSWKPLEKNINGYISDFCVDRYGKNAEEMKKVYTLFMPFVPLLSWDNHPLELFCNPTFVMKWISENNPKILSSEYKDASSIIPLTDKAVEILKILARIKADNEFVLRDIYDIARVVTGRYIHIGLHEVMAKTLKWKENKENSEEISTLMEKCIALTKLLYEILGQHKDYSLLSSYEKLFEEERVNPQFETTLKENASCEYNRTHVYEHTRFLYVPEMEIACLWLKECFEKGEIADISHYMDKVNEINNSYLTTPLSTLERMVRNREEVFSETAEKIKKFF